MILYVNNDYFNAGVPKRFTMMGQILILFKGCMPKLNLAFYLYEVNLYYLHLNAKVK